MLGARAGEASLRGGMTRVGGCAPRHATQLRLDVSCRLMYHRRKRSLRRGRVLSKVKPSSTRVARVIDGAGQCRGPEMCLDSWRRRRECKATPINYLTLMMLFMCGTC
jgi:hypothetical protein